MRSRSPKIALVAGLLAAGCFQPSFQEPLCNADGQCPPGMTCLWQDAACASPTSAPEASMWTPEHVCNVDVPPGDGDFRIVDQLDLFHGLVETYLLADTRTSRRCALTMKYFETGVDTDLAASLQVGDAPWTTDRGAYRYYALAYRDAAGACVRFGGAAGSAEASSERQYCD